MTTANSACSVDSNELDLLHNKGGDDQVGPIANVAVYKFIDWGELPHRRQILRELCKQLELRGTILLSSEGINLFVAGSKESVQRLLDFLQVDWLLHDLEVKYSFSAKQPFNRMLVKIKREIISFGVSGIAPSRRTSTKLSPDELKTWLDQGRPVQLLDVRNDYEVELGTFHGAHKLGISHFREFPDAVGNLPDSFRQQPVVMFCTGGIRCEKAGPLMEQLGFENVYQLDGGILKYFDCCGAQHYEGSCFVFDSRVALDPALRPTGLVICYACQAVLNCDDLQSPQYQFAKSCPHCYKSSSERIADILAARSAKLQEFVKPLPGCTPYENRRVMYVASRFAGCTLIDFLCQYQGRIARSQWLDWLDKNQITSSGRPISADSVVSAGQMLVQVMPDTIEPPVNANIEWLHEDRSLVVINKPAPLPVHASGRFHRNTLMYMLEHVYRPEKLRLAHRLDAATTGVVVICRKRVAARFVQPQFESGQVEKLYLARVLGHPHWEQTSCDVSIAAEPGEFGKRQVAHGSKALAAYTEFRVLQHLEDGTSLIEARPRTGRTNQIRIHLSELGHAIMKDKLYSNSDAKSASISTNPEAAICLHAWQIRLVHPETRQLVEFQAAKPEWANC